MLSPRTGLGLVETALLDVVAGAGRRRSDRVLGALEREHGIGPRYGYEVLTDLVVPWRLHLPLLEGRGNLGSQYGDPPADATYTEVQLSAVGALAVAAERGELGPVPLGLIEGSLYRGGGVPPFDPGRVIAALQRAVAGRDRRRCPPAAWSPDRSTRCWPAGRRGSSWAASSSGSRGSSSSPTSRSASTSTGSCRASSRAAAGRGPPSATTCPVTIEVDCRLPAPMSTRLRTWDRGDGSGLAALAALL